MVRATRLAHATYLSESHRTEESGFTDTVSTDETVATTVREGQAGIRSREGVK